MPTNPGVSEVIDKNGVIADIEAKRFDGTRSVQLQGDITASQTWNGDSATALILNTSIGAKKVTTDKINDKAVGTVQIADDAVGLTQIDDNAMTSAATSGDGRLITSGGVRTEIDNAILNRGKDYGPMTPTQINAISETIPTGSTVHVTAAGTITDGDIEVRQGEDLKYYRGNGEHYWYSMDGDFKLKQQAKTSPTASGSTLEFIDSITQDENGEITASKKAVQDGSTSQKGVVQLLDSHASTATDKAATPKNVKEAYDLADGKITKVPTAVENNLAAFDNAGEVKDSGIGSGTLSTALTKLDGIAAGAEVNVQADWMQTNSSADDLVKNKPLYRKYMSAATIFKVCTAKANNNTEVSYFKYLVRFKDGSVIGEVVFRNGVFIFQKNAKATEASTSTATVKFYSIASETTGFLDIYASAGAYTELRIDAISNGTSSVQIDFTNMGTNVTSLPEGATEITPVWVANSATSSGTAPVKVDAYGALTPVPMDSTPTASSTNLMTSGDIKTALDSVSSNVYPWFAVAANGTTKLFKVCDIVMPSTTSYNGTRFIFEYCGEYNSSALPTASGTIEVRIKSNGPNASPYLYMCVTTLPGIKSDNIDASFKLYYKYDSTEHNIHVVLAILAAGSFYNGYRCRIKSCYRQNGANIDSYVTPVASITEYTPAEGYVEETTNVSEIGTLYYNRSAVGSSAVPVYVNVNGEAKACAVDSAPTASSVNLVTSDGIKTALDGKQNSLPTSGTASDSYAINITGNAATATKPNFVTLTSSDDLNNIKGSERGDILEYVWLNTSIPSNVPVSGSSGILLVVNKGSAQYTKQICFVPGTNKIWCRYQTNGSWGTWAQFLETGDVKSTYSSSGTDPVNGTAVAAALGTLDVTDTAVSHQFVTAVSETDGKVSITRAQPAIADVDGLQTALDAKQSAITWMTESEARSIWTNAKAAVAAS